MSSAVCCLGILALGGGEGVLFGSYSLTRCEPRRLIRKAPCRESLATRDAACENTLPSSPNHRNRGSAPRCIIPADSTGPCPSGVRRDIPAAQAGWTRGRAARESVLLAF